MGRFFDAHPLGRFEAAMAGDHIAVPVDQDRVGPPEVLDAPDDEVDLLGTVRLRVLRMWFKLGRRPVGDGEAAGYDYSTEPATSSWTTYSLTPSGREVDAELSYGSSLWNGSGWVGGNLFIRRQPSHIARADTDYGAAIRFTLGS